MFVLQGSCPGKSRPVFAAAMWGEGWWRCRDLTARASAITPLASPQAARKCHATIIGWHRPNTVRRGSGLTRSARSRFSSLTGRRPTPAIDYGAYPDVILARRESQGALFDRGKGIKSLLSAIGKRLVAVQGLEPRTLRI